VCAAAQGTRAAGLCGLAVSCGGRGQSCHCPGAKPKSQAGLALLSQTLTEATTRSALSLRVQFTLRRLMQACPCRRGGGGGGGGGGRGRRGGRWRRRGQGWRRNPSHPSRPPGCPAHAGRLPRGAQHAQLPARGGWGTPVGWDGRVGACATTGAWWVGTPVGWDGRVGACTTIGTRWVGHARGPQCGDLIAPVRSYQAPV